MITNSKFLCPNCKGHLKVSQNIILLARKIDGNSCLVLANPKLGNYDVKMHPSINIFETGDVVDFICPICYKSLDAAEFAKDLAKIVMQSDNGEESTVIFSKTLGEKCTYKISDDGLQSYGKDLGEYKSALSFLLIFPELNTPEEKAGKAASTKLKETLLTNK